MEDGDRHLDWDGCRNVRDLGGLPTLDGRNTRPRALVRADALDRLTAEGWAALWAHGVRTVVDLRNDDERQPDAASRPRGLTTLHVPLDGADDRPFWDEWGTGPQFGTPRYYGPHLERMPQRSARALAAIARAAPGGVAVHCGRGRDRTGQVVALALAVAEVLPEAIAADYGLSAARLTDHAEETAAIEAHLAGLGTTAGEVIIAWLSRADVRALLHRGGLTPRDEAALRDRLVGA